jgi:hypothetical protein
VSLGESFDVFVFLFFFFFFIRVVFFVSVRVVSNFEFLSFPARFIRARASTRRRVHRRVVPPAKAFPPRRIRRRSETVAYTHERRVRRPGDALFLNRHLTSPSFSGGNADSRSRLI